MQEWVLEKSLIPLFATNKWHERGGRKALNREDCVLFNRMKS